ncbi:MAG: GGDEF domain-containing protein [Sphingomicrobium sp.]
MTSADLNRIAEKALRLLASWKLPPDPETFEVAYAHVSGCNPALTGSIRLLLRTKGGISLSDITSLKARYFRQRERGRSVLEAGEKLSDEVDEIASLIEVSVGRRLELQGRLKQTKARLGLPLNRTVLREIVNTVLTTAQEFGRENLYLGATLRQSCDDISRLHEQLTVIQTETLTDAVTGLANRQGLNRFLQKLLTQSRGTGESLSLLMADIDHFSAFNKSHGQLTGDHVLKLVASKLRRNVKDSDLVARYGSDMFAVVLGRVDLPKACAVAERLRQAVAANHVERRSTKEQLGHATISVGVAMARPDQSARALIVTAQTYLQQAKRTGRNRVFSELDCCERPETVPENSIQALQPTRRVATA